MPADALVESELRSLSDQLAAPPPPAGPQPAGGPSSSDHDGLQGLIGELAEEAARFLKEAERDVAQHPAASIGAALLAGIVIGVLLGRR